MTLTEAIATLREELALDKDDLVILTDVLVRLNDSAYNEGWEEGMTEGQEIADYDERLGITGYEKDEW